MVREKNKKKGNLVIINEISRDLLDVWKELDLRLKGQGQVLNLTLTFFGNEQADFFSLKLNFLIVEMKENNNCTYFLRPLESDRRKRKVLCKS